MPDEAHHHIQRGEVIPVPDRIQWSSRLSDIKAVTDNPRGRSLISYESVRGCMNFRSALREAAAVCGLSPTPSTNPTLVDINHSKAVFKNEILVFLAILGRGVRSRVFGSLGNEHHKPVRWSLAEERFSQTSAMMKKFDGGLGGSLRLRFSVSCRCLCVCPVPVPMAVM